MARKIITKSTKFIVLKKKKQKVLTIKKKNNFENLNVKLKRRK